jgi:hypothetical protein
MKVMPQAENINLGDTLILTITIPYDNIDIRNNNRINIQGAEISEFGLDFTLLNKTIANTLFVEDRQQFSIVPIQGASRPLTEVRLQNRFATDQTGYVYKACIIPLKKGLVNIANYRAEARIKNGCELIDFTPVCINNPNNYDLQYQFMQSFGNFDYYNQQNRYHVWVR